jgi:ABC-2 type transport system permease protein
MLWYKAWLETRERFFICLALMTMPACTLFAMLPRGLNESAVYFKLLFDNNLISVVIWIMDTILLGLGGLLRERALGSSAFTLALPVSRAQLMLVRVGTGFLESVALAVTPWFFVFAVCKFCETPFSISQAGCCILLQVVCGSMYFAFAVLVSSLIEGEYTAAVVAYGMLIVMLVVVASADREQVGNFFLSVTGIRAVDQQTSLFLEPLPWLTMFGNVAACSAMVLGAIAVTRRKAF